MILGTSLLLLPVFALAQQQAPPDVDQELRARVSAFYENFLEDSYSPRKAEAFVAEDTKEFFYNALKQKYKAFKILKVTYSDNFTKAVVVVSAKMETMIAGQVMVVDWPKDTHWKIEDGKWYFMDHPEDRPATPMSEGKNPPPATEAEEGHTAGVKPKNSSPEETRKAGMSVLQQQTMGVDKGNITFVVDQPSTAQVVFTNGADGDITIALDGPVVRGLKAKLDKTTVPGHGTAILSLQYDPSDKTGPKDVWEPKGNIPFRIFASPFDRIFPVSVQFIGHN
jgi:uncharacterized protein YchJ